MSSEAMVGSVNFWATICNVETTPQYKIGTAADTMPAQWGVSIQNAIPAETIAAVVNWMAASSMGLTYEIIAAQNMTAEHQRTNADQHIATGQTEIFFYTQQVHTAHPKKHGQPYQPGTFLFEQK